MKLRRKFLSSIGEEASAPTVLGANFGAGFVAGTLAAAATSPLDVARTRQQIEVIFFSRTAYITWFRWKVLFCLVAQTSYEFLIFSYLRRIQLEPSTWLYEKHWMKFGGMHHNSFQVFFQPRIEILSYWVFVFFAHTHRDGGIRGLFAGAGPRVVRAGPSVGIVVSFYEVVKYALHHREWKE